MYYSKMYSKCPWGCLFDGDKLGGDCRVPELDSCAMRDNKIVTEGSFAKPICSGCGGNDSDRVRWCGFTECIDRVCALRGLDK